MFSSKKGEAVDILMHPVFITFVALAVLLYLLWFVHGIGSESVFEKKFLAEDIALTIDSLLAARGNVVVYYQPQKQDYVPEFNYYFKKNQVIVHEDEVPESSAGRFFFTSDPKIDFKEKRLKFSEPFILPVFAKLGNRLIVDDAHNPEDNFNIFLLDCPDAKFDYKKITLDPAHGFNKDLNQGSTGFTTDKLEEFILTREISSMANTLDYGFIGVLTRESDIYLPINSRKNMIEDSLVSLHIGSSLVTDNLVKAYINYDSEKREQSLKLACELVNEISSALIEKKIKITGIAVVPVIPEQKSDRQFSILVKDKPAVLLEIGNINVPNTFSHENKRAIASAIIQGMKNAQK
ncbi:N-acetylmuramoyl-L-alanine amidase [Candidatus Woesearchaeota archaeon]|nr:N-acetylmuramoyl-L-alanine amidase [Candidatus Woesearchaeota archaeon]